MVSVCAFLFVKDDDMAKNTKAPKVTRGKVSVNARSVSAKSAKSLAASALTQRAAKTGRFADVVKAVGARDRAGLIKLADR